MLDANCFIDASRSAAGAPACAQHLRAWLAQARSAMDALLPRVWQPSYPARPVSILSTASPSWVTASTSGATAPPFDATATHFAGRGRIRYGSVPNRRVGETSAVAGGPSGSSAIRFGATQEGFVGRGGSEWDR